METTPAPGTIVLPSAHDPETALDAAATAFRLESIGVHVLRVPADPPVQTSFGVMHDRPAVLIEVRGDDGVSGWGEVWCNFPVVGAEHRGRLAAQYLPPLAVGRSWSGPQQCLRSLAGSLAVLAIQCGEPGPLHQIVAGLDMAVWDMLARRAGLPLWRLLGAADVAGPPVVPVYASGINPTDPERLAADKLDAGYRAFKLKVGFGAGRDRRNLHAVRDVIGPQCALMVDANQAWSVDEAIEAGRLMAPFGLQWLEEPIRADLPPSQWTRIAREQPLPLAGGENLAGTGSLLAFAGTPGVAVVQPDIGKWGGFSGCVPVGRGVLAQRRLFCPHWLGAGIGLRASLHLKAAVGGDGPVEVDANPNPLRDLLAGEALRLRDGAVTLDEAPGLGIVPDPRAWQAFTTFSAG